MAERSDCAFCLLSSNLECNLAGARAERVSGDEAGNGNKRVIDFLDLLICVTGSEMLDFFHVMKRQNYLTEDDIYSVDNAIMQVRFFAITN